ncbi:redoxin domain-containing protein [Paenalkalicoccus suaedae]|uniref:Redoxin domain-containing protein n=1 Tax=Paenalkalicoccus suaedae TaxID=2592382 RepID=A0A859FK75_9BACI|nr:AhpC/TSA family protein [Paenalkalicoccus suaedae]QKS73176.1 redoxin domain-containing protein [Paenalkalicoccus suaedae]
MCREHLAQLRENYHDFKDAGIEIKVIVPSKGSYIAQFEEAFGAYPFAIYSDPSRKLYKEAGHKTMPKAKLLAMATLGAVTGKVKNFLPKEKAQKDFAMKSMKTQDVYIQGGTWLIDESQQVVWNWIDKDPTNHVTIPKLKLKAKEHLGIVVE